MNVRLFGLRNNKVLLSEFATVATRAEAAKLANHRLGSLDAVEVWLGPMMIFRATAIDAATLLSDRHIPRRATKAIDPEEKTLIHS